MVMSYFHQKSPKNKHQFWFSCLDNRENNPAYHNYYPFFIQLYMEFLPSYTNWKSGWDANKLKSFYLSIWASCIK